MKTYKIYLIRNGYTKGSIEGRYIGHTDESLSYEGRKQLINLMTQYSFPNVEAVISSPLKRCVETAKIIYPEKNPIIIDDIKECNFGDFEGLTADELADNDDFKEWIKGSVDLAPPFGESNRAFYSRICTGFIKIIDGILKSGITETAIITHGGVIMSWLAAFGLPEAPMADWRTPAGCGYMLRLDASIWSKINKIEVIDEIPFPLENEEESDMPEYFWGDYNTDTVQ